MSKTKEKKIKTKRSLWFRGLKSILRLFIKSPKFVYLGEEVEQGSLILSNHVGAKAPLAYELYFQQPFRFWGTYEMNSNIFKVYAYLSKIYFHQKKHWNLFLARVFCIIAAPLLWLFYRGLNLISTYPDYRFKNTIKESIRTFEHNQSIVIFPEDSSKGYFDELTQCFSGFTLLGRRMLKQDKDLSVHFANYRKKDKTLVISEAVKFSELMKFYPNQDNLAEMARKKINQLGKQELK